MQKFPAQSIKEIYLLMIFDENSRLKIPSNLHLIQLGLTNLENLWNNSFRSVKDIPNPQGYEVCETPYPCGLNTTFFKFHHNLQYWLMVY